jgi:glycosyltransferase involved in cell wall biosynthesis
MLTVIVPCYNNEDIIRDCLESVKWADEILICDSFSTDKTLNIVREYTNRIIQHKYINSATQKNWAIPQASNEWVFIVDTDERISKELKDEVMSILKNPDEFDGFKIPRANYSFGKRLRYGGYWPDYQLRLFKKTKGRYQPREVHAHVVLEGKIGYLKNPIIHFPNRELEQVIEKLLIKYAKWEAKERLKKEKPSIAKLIIAPTKIFIYRYILMMGFLDGVGGFIAANLWAMYTFLTYLYMLQWQEKK